jgi:SAM-dependent methyltransferase
MNVRDLLETIRNPELYEPGDAIMWTDEHISGQLLELHLNPEIDAASRKPESIEHTLEFVLKFCNTPKTQILDLGCGPGIYSEKLALKGHRVTGIDFSENSIKYAKKQAIEKKLNIEYICQNYLELQFDEQFDLTILIYTDFGVLIPEERNKILSLIYKALKPGGIFIFDVLNDRNINQKFKDQRTWQIEDRGFWRNHPYLELINGIHYQNEHVFLKQHTIIDKKNKCMTYRFWVHYYNADKLIPILKDKGYENIITFNNILPESDIWNGENVTFYVTNKPE